VGAEDDSNSPGRAGGSAASGHAGGEEPRRRMMLVRAVPRQPREPLQDGGLSPALAQAATALLSLEGEEETPELQDALEAVREACHVDAVVVTLLDERGETFRSVLCAAHPDSRIKAARLLGRALASLPELARHIAHGGFLPIADCLAPDDTQRAESAWLMEAGVRAGAFIGLAARERPLGAIALCSEDCVSWGAGFIQPLKLVGSAFAAGLDRLRTQRALDSVLERQQLETLAANDGVWDFDMMRNQTHFSPRWKRMLGYDEHELNDNLPDWRTLVHPEDYPSVQARLREHLDGRTELFESVHRLRHRNGEWRWVLSRAKASRIGARRHRRLVGVELDITERKHYEEALHREKESVLITLQSIGEGVIRTDADNCVEYLNPVAEALTGWQLDTAQGRPLDDLFKTYHEETCEPLENPLACAMRRGRSIKSVRPTLLIRTSDYNELFVESTASPIREPSGDIGGGVLVFHDVSESRELQRRLSFHASHDVLTGLYNRQEFEQRAEQALEAAKSGEERFALCFIDVDQFKVVNDSCGHSAGDALLAHVGALLKGKTRWRDTLARLGGDEFAVLMEGTSLEDAMRAADALREEVQSFRFTWQEKVFRLSVSMGVVPISPDSPDVAGLLAAADVACQAAKEAGRNRVHAYEVDDVVLISRRREMQWAARLNSALDADRFELYRQFIQPLGDKRREVGDHYELLVRLKDEHGNAVSPARFIGAAERFGITPGIDRWVVSHAFEWLLANPAELERLAVCSINLSAQSLADERFLPFLVDQLERTRLPGDRFCFEITETAAVSSYPRAQQFIERMKRYGCRFALDDFGVGMASFTPLRHLPVDYVKIDGSFVRGIETDPVDREMVKSINDLCQRLGKETIAEFAENARILEVLREIGVDYAQGYAVSEPRPVSEPRVVVDPRP
jgi:diguanylate cyclase (GGDEF)-like protein/PAS domain S-box-containing protein